jgi:lysophospholipase L1-like esterase
VSTSAHESMEQVARQIPLRKKLAFILTIWVAVFLVAELGSRVGAYFLYQRSPFFLFYGFHSFMADQDPEGHSAAYEGYFKFPPNRTLKQYGLYSKPTPIRINSHGFRGREFSAAKPDSVIRVISVGESSTFGFYDSDEGTYPALLGDVLGKRFEVINAGIPHSNSDNIRAMVLREILEYRPNVLTVYAGYNDAIEQMNPSALYRTLIWIHGHFASYVALKTAIAKLGGPALPSRWSTQSGSDSATVNRQIRLHTERYRSNLTQIIKAAGSKGIRVVLIKQAVRPGGTTSAKTYADRVHNAQQTLQKGGKVSGDESMLVVHAALMGVLDSLGSENRLPVLDYIAVADRHPEFYASYVHLTEDGNRAMAELLRPVIERVGSGSSALRTQ